ncbi:MAG: tetratricopeptide repeat protein, partial [Myxococcota bacterium]
LFPGRRWVTLLATSRRRIDEARAATLSIGVLHPNEARRLLLQNVVHRDGVTEAEWDAVATWVGHLPLALELLNRALVHLVLSPVKLREITQERSPVWVGDALREGLRGHVADGALRGISETLRITSERLPETARRVARVSAWLAPAPVPEPLIEALCNGTDITATRALLESRSVWIRGLNSATWSMHELVADYFRVTSPNPLADWRMAVRALNTLVEGDAATRAELRPVLFALVAAAGELASRIPEVANLADGQALRRTAGWLSDLGESSGTPAALMVARRLIERGVNSLLTRDLAPHDWAQAQNNLGRVLWILGKRGGEETTLEQAIGAYRGALEVFTRPSVPTAWALVMNNLGNALRDLGELRGDVATLERSAEAFVATLEVYSYGETPMRWAGTQNNLGTVYQFLGERRGDEAALKQAIDAYQAALEVRTQSDTAMDWAMTQSNLGAALGTLGALRENEDTLEKAIDAYCEALEVYSRRETPVEWAMTLSNLGNLLQVLGAHRGDEVALEQAVDTFHDVLEVYTRQAARFDWARTQNNLGTALHALGERREGEEELQQAIGAYRLALEVLTRNATAAGWARTQNNLGNVLRVLGERCGDEEILRQAIAAYEAALEVRTRKADQVGWARTQNNLGNVFRVFSTLVGSEAFRRQAVEAYLKALEVLESLGHHHAIRVTRRNLDLVGG